MVFFVIIFICGFFPQTQIGKLGGQVQGFSNSLNFTFTILSSNEWKVIILNLPSSFSLFTLSSIALFNIWSSLFTSILIAWNVLLAGCPSLWNLAGIAFLIISTNSPVVSIDFSILFSTINLAIFLENFSSP